MNFCLTPYLFYLGTFLIHKRKCVKLGNINSLHYKSLKCMKKETAGNLLNITDATKHLAAKELVESKKSYSKSRVNIKLQDLE